MAWFDNAVFYHIYPLGLCGCPHENNGEQQEHMDQLISWAHHAKELNCTAIYLGPCFMSGSHGYDTSDYKKVDNRLGTNDGLKQFVKDCHENGMKVIFDGVFNHVGRGFFAFEDLKKNRENSAYRDWFCNVNFGCNNEYNDGFCYDNWGGYNLLVKLNLRNPEVIHYLFDVIQFWVTEFDVDGLRLDAADVLDREFMKQLRSFCDSIKEEFWLMGEVIHGDYSLYANDSMLYSVTNYELHKGLYSGHNDHNYFEIAHSVRRLLGICKNTRLYTFSDNHDVERLAEKLKVSEHAKLIAILVYTLYGIPSIYYGSEFFIKGKKENGSDWPIRPCLNLEEYEHFMKEEDSLAFLYQKLGELKKDYPELSFGKYEELLLTNRQYVFTRIGEQGRMIIALNCDDTEAHITIPLHLVGKKVDNLLNQGKNITITGDCIQLDLMANEGTILWVTDEIQ